jgi:hypothetical protein
VHLYFERGSPKAVPAARRWLVRYLVRGRRACGMWRRSRRVWRRRVRGRLAERVKAVGSLLPLRDRQTVGPQLPLRRTPRSPWPGGGFTTGTIHVEAARPCASDVALEWASVRECRLTLKRSTTPLRVSQRSDYRIAEREHNCTDRGQSHTPSNDECQALCAPSIGADHEYDGVIGTGKTAMATARGRTSVDAEEGSRSAFRLARSLIDS